MLFDYASQTSVSMCEAHKSGNGKKQKPQPVSFRNPRTCTAGRMSKARQERQRVAMEQKTTLSPKFLLYLNCSRDTWDKIYAHTNNFCLRNLWLNLCQVTELRDYWEAEFLLLSQESVLSGGSGSIATHRPLIGVFVAVNTVGVLFMKRFKALLYMTTSDEIRGFHKSANDVHATFTSSERLTLLSLLQAVSEIAAILGKSACSLCLLFRLQCITHCFRAVLACFRCSLINRVHRRKIVELASNHNEELGNRTRQ